MPDPGLVALLATPLACGAVLAVVCRRRLAAATPVRGLAVVPLVVVASFAAARLQGDQVSSGIVPDPVVNRLLAGVILLAAAAFLVVNRRQPSRLVRWAVRATAAGAASNAAATMVFGSMPVLAAAVNADGGYLVPGEHPDPRYLAVDSSQPLAVVIGDVLPLPPLDAVVSVGDLLLVPGCAVLLAYFLALLLAPDHPERHPKHRNGAGAESATTGATAPASAVAGSAPAASAACTWTSTDSADASLTAAGLATTHRTPACSHAAVIPISSSPQRTEERPTSQADSRTTSGTDGS
jgi:hypothetical protein